LQKVGEVNACQQTVWPAAVRNDDPAVTGHQIAIHFRHIGGLFDLWQWQSHHFGDFLPMEIHAIVQ
jgi:hypothetical protein